jgi:hypothetical protein
MAELTDNVTLPVILETQLVTLLGARAQGAEHLFYTVTT